MSSPWVFDKSHYDALNVAREAAVQSVLPDLKNGLALKTVLDLGCGLGHYSQILHKYGFDVLAVDGRPENVAEARHRYPHLKFEIADAEDPKLGDLGKFDLVFCFGLLYHLENPLRVIRNIARLTNKFTLVEGMVYPTPEPAMVLMDENDAEDQALKFVAFYPSESCLIKMLRRAGFSECFMPARMPKHSDYDTSRNGFRRRTLLGASKVPVNSTTLVPWPDPSPKADPWEMLPLYPSHPRAGAVYGAVDRWLHSKRRRGDQQ